ncbi:MAG TPA: hypothetical protein VEI94_10160 [Candidatus Bathyarchaeia archaeon]|nr:hypothetical protein [Candidatus Bathyarchaeia archaeon]
MRRALAYLTMLLGGAAIGLGIVELSLRVAPNGLLPCFNKSAGVWQMHPLFGWFHVPSSTGWGQVCLSPRRYEWRIVNRINSNGLNDRERSYEKAPGTFRILVLGDSFTEAAQLPIEDGFVSRLERKLATRAGSSRRYEVLNTGVSAWSTDNELLFFRHEGIRYAPDLVLLAITPGNDIGENVSALGRPFFRNGGKPTFTLEEDGRLLLHDFPGPAARRRGWLASAEDVLWRRTRTYPLLLHVVGRSGPEWLQAGPAPAADANRAPPDAGRPRAIPPILGFALDPLPPDWARAWELTKALVRDLRGEVERSGSRFAATIVPSKFEVGGLPSWLPIPKGLDVSFEREDERVEAFLTAEGIPTCPLLPALRAHLAETGRSGYFIWDVHWTSEGHAVVADAIGECLDRLGLLGEHR